MPIRVLMLLALVAFLIRFLPRLFRRNAIVSDTYYHLYCANLIRARRFRHPDTVPSVILANKYTYPFGYHYLLAFFPPAARIWAERATGAAFDTLNLFIVYAAAVWFFRRGGLPGAPRMALVAAVLYAFSPALLRVGSGPRCYNGSARVPGQTLFLAHFLSAYVAWTTGGTAWVVVSVLAGAVLLFSASFSTQVFFFFGLGFSVLVTPAHLVLMVACVGVSALMTGGKTLAVLRGRIIHSTFYCKYLQRIFLYPHIIPFTRYLAEAWAALGQLARGRLVAFVRWYYHANHYLHILAIAFPQIVLLAFLDPWRSLTGPDGHFLGVWLASGVFWFLLTRQWGFLFLGEGERYLEAVMLPSLLLFVAGARGRAEWLLAAMVVYFALSAVYLVWDYMEQYKSVHEAYTESEEVFQHLRLLPSGAVLPLGNVQWQAIHRSTNRVLAADMVDPKLLAISEFLLVYGNYPYPGSDIRTLVNHYEVEYILAQPDGLHAYLGKILPDSRAFWDEFLLIRQTQGMLLLVRKRSFKALETRFRDAAARLDGAAARACLAAMLSYLPQSRILAAAWKKVDRLTGDDLLIGLPEEHVGRLGEMLKQWCGLVGILGPRNAMLKAIVRGDRQVVVCGAGMAAGSIATLGRILGLEIRCFTDKNAKRQHQDVERIPVLSLEEGLAFGLPCVVGAAVYAAEIAGEIRERAGVMGIPAPMVYLPEV